MFSAISSASWAYSAGLPMRLGNGTAAPHFASSASGSASPKAGARNVPGARVTSQIPRARQRHADHAALGRAGSGLPDGALERRDRRGGDDDPAFALGEGLA